FASYRLPEPSKGASRIAAIQASLRILDLAPRRFTVPLLASVYRAPLADFLPVSLSLFIEGRTGSQKTELSAIAQGHYGKDFNGKQLPGNWESTENALEREASHAKDALFVVD